MFTPVGMVSSGGCLWLHYAVKMKWDSGGDLIRWGLLDQWERRPLHFFVFFFAFELLMVHISHFNLFFFYLFLISSLSALKFDCGKWFTLICSFVSPSPSSFVPAVCFQRLLGRWAFTGPSSNDCVWTALLSRVVLNSLSSICSLCCPKKGQLHLSETHNVSPTMLYYDRTMIDHYCWWSNKLYFLAIVFFFLNQLTETE